MKHQDKVPFRAIFISCAVVVAGFLTDSSAFAAEAETVTTDLTTNWDASTPLANPDKGWYHHYYDDGLQKYLVKQDGDLTNFPGMDHLYLRLAWSYLEPQEGRFKWDVLDKVIEKWTKLGYGIGFRITCKETRVWCPEQQYATPKWVMDAGAKGGYYPSEKSPVIDKELPWEPDYGDPVFLAKLENFIRAFAARYDGQPWLRYVDVGSFGDWGEGHTSHGSGKPYDWQTRLKHLEIYRRYFKKTLLLAGDDFVQTAGQDGADKLRRYVLGQGLSYRDDSILVSHWVQKCGKTFSVANAGYFADVFQNRPTVVEMEHLHQWATNGIWEGKAGSVIAPFHATGADFMRGAIWLEHATYIGYHGDAAKWLSLPGNPKISNELLNLCGYWYFPHQLTRPIEFDTNRSNRISMVWEDRGVAPAYHPYQLVLRFQGPETFEVAVDSGNMHWLPARPAKTWTENYEVKIPKQSPPGEYTLSFRLWSPLAQRPVLLPLAPALKNPENLFTVGKVLIGESKPPVKETASLR